MIPLLMQTSSFNVQTGSSKYEYHNTCQIYFTLAGAQDTRLKRTSFTENRKTVLKRAQSFERFGNISTITAFFNIFYENNRDIQEILCRNRVLPRPAV